MVHYNYEDIPPADGDTQIDMYQQARQLTLDAPIKANAAMDMIAAALEELYRAAESRADEPAMLAINDAWERTNSIVQHIVHGASALAGADIAIDTLRNQRESLAYELETLIDAINSLDASDPRLEDAFNTLREEAAEEADEWATDVLDNSMYETMRPIIREIDPQANIYKRTEWLIQLFTGDRLMTDEQRHLVTALFQTMGN